MEHGIRRMRRTDLTSDIYIFYNPAVSLHRNNLLKKGNMTDQSVRRFGTFLGVYTPSVLTILGVMMYLRFGWVVGNIGLPLSLFTVLLASSITFITGLSASAISTNMRVGVGGEYFMISRSLGMDIGGAIGIPLFLCRTLSLTLYAFGLSESIAFLYPQQWGVPPITLMTIIIIVLIISVAGKSADISLKLQLPIMGAVGLSLIALATGVLTGGFHEPEWVPHFERSAPGGFWYVFAVFFPAVTGFTAGIGMSGDLKDPKKSIPKGTMFAVITGTLVYLLVTFLLGTSAKISGDELAVLDPNAPPIWARIALAGPWLIFPGMWGAILSSAFGSALSGPRVLQALARDGLFPKILAKASRSGQPMIATWVTGIIAIIAVALGDLNAVGRWVTIFFLTLYVMINLAAALEKLAGDPYYRPTIRLHWTVSLLGSAGAVAVMFLISPSVCMSSIGIVTVLFLFMRRWTLKSSMGDVRIGLWTAIARFSLLKLRQQTWHPRSWRPQILLFASNPTNRLGLVRLATWFNQNRGVVTIYRLIKGDLRKNNVPIPNDHMDLEETLLDHGLVGFCKASVVSDIESGIINIAQANGFAGLQGNTAMFGWPDNVAGLEKLLKITTILERLDMSTLIARLPNLEGPFLRRRIDIWWRGKQRNGDMMLLLSHLLSLNSEWRSSRIYIRTIINSEKNRDTMREKLESLISDLRIEAEPDIIINSEKLEFAEIVHKESVNSDVTFLGMRLPEEDRLKEYAETLFKVAKGNSSFIFVRNASQYRGKLIS
ncbi:amino acid permease [Thermodesulfobacteriota bacterium]